MSIERWQNRMCADGLAVLNANINAPKPDIVKALSAHVGQCRECGRAMASLGMEIEVDKATGFKEANGG